MSLGNAPGGWGISEVFVKSLDWKPTVVWCVECPGRIESQLDVRGDDLLGQFVGTHRAVKSSAAGVRTPLDRKS